MGALSQRLQHIIYRGCNEKAQGRQLTFKMRVGSLEMAVMPRAPVCRETQQIFDKFRTIRAGGREGRECPWSLLAILH